VIDYDAVVAQHWGDDRIRGVFIDDGGLSEYHNPINGAEENRRIMGAIFDAWLRSVKAKAWDEGFNACANWWEIHHHGVMRDERNPYREANG
jgi:hypothetical protein